MIRVATDVRNPGQFFACCGLLELADRMWPTAEGQFGTGEFRINCDGSLDALTKELSSTTLVQTDKEDNGTTPIELPTPFNLTLDWWRDERSGGGRLKVWAGSMGNYRIARAMHAVLGRPDARGEGLMDYGTVVPNPDKPKDKVEPFYFDSRRGVAAHSRDIGFSPNDLGLSSIAYPVVELLCLVGLQRFRPRQERRPRTFTYHTWDDPLPPLIAAAVVSGAVVVPGVGAYRFDSVFRSGQKKHKGFGPGIPQENRHE